MKNNQSIQRLAHTPGPWRIGKNYRCVVSDHRIESTHHRIGHRNDDGGANEYEYYGGNMVAESVLREENSKLMAAAPDMYHILYMLAHVKTKTERHRLLQDAEQLVRDIAPVAPELPPYVEHVEIDDDDEAETIFKE